MIINILKEEDTLSKYIDTYTVKKVERHPKTGMPIKITKFWVLFIISIVCNNLKNIFYLSVLLIT